MTHSTSAKIYTKYTWTNSLCSADLDATRPHRSCEQPASLCEGISSHAHQDTVRGPCLGWHILLPALLSSARILQVAAQVKVQETCVIGAHGTYVTTQWMLSWCPPRDTCGLQHYPKAVGWPDLGVSGGGDLPRKEDSKSLTRGLQPEIPESPATLRQHLPWWGHFVEGNVPKMRS